MSIQNSQQISDIKTMLVKGMNGEGIESIEKTATEGFIDTYTITYTDGTKTTFDVTNGNWGIWTSAVTAAQGATSVTINNDAIGTTSILEVYSQNVSGTVITVNDIDVTPGTAVLTFPALAEATDFILHIVNGTASGGGGGGSGTTDYLDLTNKPQINGITLTGNKTTADFGLVNTFLGDLTEWNALSTDEKKSYDHASITGTGGGEYNVNRSTGNLVLTAGVPATYPASQVMMSDDVTSVEDALGGSKLTDITDWSENSSYPSGTAVTPANWTWIAHKVLPAGLYYISCVANLSTGTSSAISLLQQIRDLTHDKVLVSDSVTAPQRSFPSSCIVALTETTDIYFDVYVGGAASVYARTFHAIKLF